MTDGTSRLARMLREQIVPAKAMGIEVARYNGEELVLRAPLRLNINDKGTAFAGSLYSIAVLAGWGLAFLKLAEADLSGEIMVYKSSMFYQSPVREDLVASCRAPGAAEVGAFLGAFRAEGKGKIELCTEIRAGDEVAVSFTGRFAALA